LKEGTSKLSVTQLEVLKAVQVGIPVFAFVDDRVLQDHATYEANRDSDYADKIVFASISQPGTARYVFSFVDFLRGRIANNALFPFSRIEDITTHLRKQWAALFQRLLEEEREHAREQQRIDRLSDQFEDLKAALLTTVGDAPSRDVARGVINFRHVVTAVRSLPLDEPRKLVEDGASWDTLMEKADIRWPDGIVSLSVDRHSSMDRIMLERTQGPPLHARASIAGLRRLSQDWEQFICLPTPARMAIYDAVTDVRFMGPPVFREPPVKPPESASSSTSSYDPSEEPF
jgi:hypothetical protein